MKTYFSQTLANLAEMNDLVASQSDELTHLRAVNAQLSAKVEELEKAATKKPRKPRAPRKASGATAKKTPTSLPPAPKGK